MALMVGCCRALVKRLTNQRPRICSLRKLTSARESNGSKDHGLDPNLLDILVCPLSKTPLRYDPTLNELVCDELGVAYSIINGIPNLVPSDGRILEKGKNNPEEQPRGS